MSNPLPGAYARRVPRGGTPNAAIPDVTPALVALSNGKTVQVTDEAVTRGGTINTADALANTNVQRITKISNTAGGPPDYALTTDFLLTGDTVDWSPAATLLPPDVDTPVLLENGGGSGWTPGTFYYVITALHGGTQETLKSEEVSVVVANADDEVKLTWGRVPNATGYKIYRSTVSGTYTTPALKATIASGDTTTYTDDSGAAPGAGAPPVANTAESEPVGAAVYYVSYEYADTAAVTTNALRYTNLGDVFDSNGYGTQASRMAEMAMSTLGRGNRAPAVWIAATVDNDTPGYLAALNLLNQITREVLIVVMGKINTTLRNALFTHLTVANGVDKHQRRTAITWSASGAAIGSTSTVDTLLYDAYLASRKDVVHIAVDSGSCTIPLLQQTDGTYAEQDPADHELVAAAVAGMAAGLPDAAEPWTRKIVENLGNLGSTEYSDPELTQLRDGGVTVIDYVKGTWRILEGVNTLTVGEVEDTVPSCTLADFVIEGIWWDQIDPSDTAPGAQGSLIGNKITDGLIEQVITRTMVALDIAVGRGLARSYDQNSITAVQDSVNKRKINVTYSYEAMLDAAIVEASHSFQAAA